MDENDERELLQRRLTEDIRETVEKELKRRYSWMGLIALVLTGGGLTLLVNNALFDAKVKLDSATQLQDETTKKLQEAASVATELTRSVNAAQEKAAQAEEQLQQLQETATALNNELAAQTTATLRISEDLRSDVDKLSAVVTGLITDHGQRGEANTALSTQIANVRRSIEKTASSITEQTSRAQLSKYRVTIREVTGYESLHEKLKAKGFSVSVLRRRGTPDKNRTAIVSVDTPSDITLDVLRIAKSEWPFINRLCLRERRGRGPTIAATDRFYPRRGYLCQEVSDSQFSAILNGRASKEEFQNFLAPFAFWRPTGKRTN